MGKYHCEQSQSKKDEWHSKLIKNALQPFWLCRSLRLSFAQFPASTGLLLLTGYFQKQIMRQHDINAVSEI